MHFLSAHQIYLCKMVSARVLYIVVLPMSLRIYSFLLLICCTQVLLTESATRCCVPTNFRSNMEVTGGFLSNSGPNIVDVGALLKTICGLCVYKNNELKYLSYDPLKFQHDWLQVACLFAIVSNTNHFILSKIQRRLYDSTKTSQSSSQILIYILGFYILLSYESSVQFFGFSRKDIFFAEPGVALFRLPDRAVKNRDSYNSTWRRAPASHGNSRLRQGMLVLFSVRPGHTIF